MTTRHLEWEPCWNVRDLGEMCIRDSLYPDEGHGFARPQNNLSFAALAEAFLARCLGGRVQPIGDDLTGSSLTVPIGAEEVPGLVEALG